MICIKKQENFTYKEHKKNAMKKKDVGSLLLPVKVLLCLHLQIF